MLKINSVRALHRRAISTAAVAFGLMVLLSFAGAADRPSESDHSVSIAFGFHVNLYHSFRNDTNDESGFGKDIRIIRHIIRTLDHFNANGVPVKGVWDFDNLFSLQEILPRHAPDIITDIRRRVHLHGDEVILMSYNNGLVSAMTQAELDDAIRWSITNPWKSGVLDLFGKYTPIVRPQEMMTTPGNFNAYKAHGIQAVSLYYSATPFDAFRVFSRPLTRAEAHNPLLYKHPQTGEQMVIIPTYHFGDLVEHVSLKHWVNALRNMQIRGELKQDALLFINYDADSELWEGVDLPWIMNWLPGTGGIGALVNEVKNIPQVNFTTVGSYLAEHSPIGTLSFSQDTADGSFNGYSSWAEKAGTSHAWTIIERSRRMCAAARKAVTWITEPEKKGLLQDLITAAEMTRLRALSTTNFGMATPFLARQRERAMAMILNALETATEDMSALLAKSLQTSIERIGYFESAEDPLEHLDTLMVLQSERTQPPQPGSRFINVPVPSGYRQGMALVFRGPDGQIFPTASLGIHQHHAPPLLRLYVTGRQALKDGIYHLCARADFGEHHRETDGGTPSRRTEIANGSLSVQFENGQLEGIYMDGRRQLETGSLMPYMMWNGQTFHPQAQISEIWAKADGQARSFRVLGPLPGPAGQTQSNGWMDYTFTLVPDKPYLVLDATIIYPSTLKHDILKGSAPGLVRRTDLKWHEVAPAQIRITPQATRAEPVRILKENYLAMATEYALDYFHHNPGNLNLDNVNNHITGAYVGVVTGGSGVAVAMDNSIQSNFAFAPVRMQHHHEAASFSAMVNPFGTYPGNQYNPPTWGNGNGFDATLLAGEQFAGAGPTYNGVEQTFSIMLAFFDHRNLPEAIRQDLIGFANPPTVISSSLYRTGPSPEQPLKAPQGLVAAFEAGAVRFSWDHGRETGNNYRIFCGTATGDYEIVYPAIGNSLKVPHYAHGRPFEIGRKYFASIEQVSAGGHFSKRAEEIAFTFKPAREAHPDIPLKLELKVFWANLQAMLIDWRM
jgi:hypothetical protein